MKARMLFHILLVLVLSGPAAFAGTVIHFKAGEVDPSLSVLSVNEAFSKINVIQFKSTPSEADYKKLENLNIQRFSYLPDDAFIVSIPNVEAMNQLNWPNVRAVMSYNKAFRLSSDFYINVFNQDSLKRVSVRLLSENFADEFSKSVSNHRGAIEVQEGKNFIVTIRAKDLFSLVEFEGVEYVEDAHQVELHYLSTRKLFGSSQPIQNMGEVEVMAGDYTDLSGYESGTKVMGFDQAWSRGYYGQGQIAAMSDTGLDTGVVATLRPDFTAVLKGKGFGLFTDSWKDPMGHGTHVAGSVVSNGADSLGKIRGGAYEAGFVAQGLWSDMMNNITPPSTLKTLFDPAMADGARVHTNSWGNPRAMGTYDNMAVQADEYIWNNPELLVVFAAGNSGVDANKDGRIDEGSVTSPATAKNVLSVGASENKLSKGGIQRKVGDLAGGQWNHEPLGSDLLSNNENGIAVFSSRGPTKDGRIKPDLVAPGTNILSNCSHEKDASPLWGHYNENYCYSGGTSMSAPLTAGAAVLARQFLVDAKGIASPTAAAVKASLLHTAFDMYPGQFGQAGKAAGQEMLSTAPNPNQGFGRVDMDILTQGKFEVVDNRNGVGQGQSETFVLSAQGKSKFKVTMVYMDSPGSPTASRALVNDLRVSLNIDGENFELNDKFNNFEQGNYTLDNANEIKVKVTGQRVTTSKQPYALITTLQ